MEIYGCTETGLIASRRTTSDATWETFTGIHLHCEGEAVWAQGQDIEATTPLCDVIEPRAPIRLGFSSKAAMQMLLISLAKGISGVSQPPTQRHPGVRDGIFLLPPDDETGGVRRLIALVVAPELPVDTLMQALRERIDPVFLPRPLLFTETLPRNAVGKLSAQAKQILLARLGSQTDQGPPA